MVRAWLAPRLLGLHVLALVAVGTAGWLGYWQYDAWQIRRDMAASSLNDAPAKPLTTVMSPDDPFPGDGVGQRVTFAGTWVEESTFFVADRRLNGRDGVWVVTPLAVCREPCAAKDATRDPAMLVVRGWAPSAEDPPAPPRGRADISGWLQPPEGSGLPDPDPTDDVLAELRIADAIQRVDQDLFGGYVIAGSATTGLEPVTPDSLPEPDAFTALRNLLYAAEWWLFGAFAAFVWWRWCRDEIRRKTAREDGSTSPTDQDPADSHPRTAEVASST